VGFLIALSGKGGVGKTTVGALLLRSLVKRGEKSILIVDADPNSTMPGALGAEVSNTIGGIRQDVMDRPSQVPSGMPKDAYLELLFNQIVVETKSYDLLVMGRQEGDGCYCAVNHILHRFLESMHNHYDYIIVDNEAGMEHLSRHSQATVDLMFIVTDYSIRGARSAANVETLIDEMKIPVRKRYIVANRAPEELNDKFLSEIAKTGLEIAAQIPPDDMLIDFDIEERSLIELPDDSPAAEKVAELLKKMEI
jgi:CO dehydrogenase maturation factor